MSGNPHLAGLAPTHPGEILREDILPATGLSEFEIARRLGIARETLHGLIEERVPVGAALALRLARLFGTTAEFWANLQRDYDLRTLERAMAEELAAIETLETA